MKTKFQRFDLEIICELSKQAMGLPASLTESHFRLDNHDYVPIQASWQEAKVALDHELALLQRLENADELEDELHLVSDEEYEDFDSPLQTLDLGVAAAVLALSALGCVTVASCNGGCFGDHHHESHPLVVFFAAPESAELLLQAAKRAGVGLGHDSGGLMVWANDIWAMHSFATTLVEAHYTACN